MIIIYKNKSYRKKLLSDKTLAAYVREETEAESGAKYQFVSGIKHQCACMQQQVPLLPFPLLTLFLPHTHKRHILIM